MRLLLFSDLHLDTPFRWASPALARVRRESLRGTLRRIVELADELEADALCCAGDLYEHERFASDTGEFLRATFADAGRPVLLAPGNHDWYSTAALYRQVGWSSNVVVFTEDRLSPHRLADGFTVWGAAHRAPANTDNFLDGFSAHGPGVHVALFHGSERSGLAAQGEGKRPHAPFVAAQVPAARLAHALVGHYHTPTDAPWHTYPGNPEPLTFGETGERGAVLVEVDGDGTVRRTRHTVAGTTVRDVTVELTGARTTTEVADRVTEALVGLTGVVRATLTGEVAPDIDVRLADVAGAAPQLAGLVLRTENIRVAYDLEAIGEEATVRGQFVRDVLADRGLDEDARRRVVVTGLRALDGRADELEVA